MATSGSSLPRLTVSEMRCPSSGHAHRRWARATASISPAQLVGAVALRPSGVGRYQPDPAEALRYPDHRRLFRWAIVSVCSHGPPLGLVLVRLVADIVALVSARFCGFQLFAAGFVSARERVETVD